MNITFISKTSTRPLFHLTLSFSAGIFTGYHLNFPVKTCMITALTTAILSLFLTLLKLRKIAVVFLMLSSFSVGFGYIVLREFKVPLHHIALAPPTDEVALIGRLYKSPENTPGGFRLYLALKGIETDFKRLEPVTGRIRISVTDPDPVNGYPDRLHVNDWVRVETTVSPPKGYGDPGVFDPAQYLAHKNIYLTGHMKYTEFLQRLKPGSHFHPDYIIQNLRRKCLVCLQERCRPFFPDFWGIVSPDDHRIEELSKAILLGVRNGLEDDLKLKYQRSGLYHLLAISGLHVGIIAVFLHWIFKILPVSHRVSAGLVAMGVLLYGWLAGAGPSVMRATLIVAVYMSSYCLARKADPVNLLSLAGLILLAIHPGNLFDIGFQLTFAATFGILFLTPFLQERFSKLPFQKVKGIIAVSLAAQISTAPLSAIYFNRIGGLAFLPYLLIAPIVPVALGFGVIGLLTAPLAPLSNLFLRLHATTLALMTKGADLIAKLPGMTLQVTTPDKIERMLFVLFFISLFVIAANSRLWYRKSSIGLLILFLLMIIGYPFLNEFIRDKSILNIYLLDVGNADATLIRMPSGKAILVDGGGIKDSSFDVGRWIVARTLRTIGISTLDAVVVTHPHPDHQNGILSIIEDFPVKEMWIPTRSFKDKTYKKLLMKADNLDIPLRILDDQRICKTLDLNINNRSLVLGVEYGSFHMMLPGDAEAASETGLLPYGTWLTSDVLKAGHHGSRTSCTTQFLRWVRPQLVTIPCGRNNRFGHPHKETLLRLQSLQPAPVILRSDQNGMIHIQTNGTSIVVTTYSSISI